MNLIPGIEPDHSHGILDLIRKIPGVTGIFLFGSRAKGNYREGSDIDIALKGISISHNSLDSFFIEYDKLNLPWKVDFVIYDSIETPALKDHIDRVGVSLK